MFAIKAPYEFSIYEAIYLGLFVVQTGFLIWYAFETKRLRVAASGQLETIKQQYTTMELQYQELQKQNKLIASQAEAAIEETKFQREEIIRSAEPVFSFHLISYAPDMTFVLMNNFQDNVVYSEFRCNLRYRIDRVAGTPVQARRFLFVDQHACKVAYIGIRYKTTRNEVRNQVFEVTLETGQYKPELSVAFQTLGNPTIS